MKLVLKIVVPKILEGLRQIVVVKKGVNLLCPERFGKIHTYLCTGGQLFSN